MKKSKSGIQRPRRSARLKNPNILPTPLPLRFTGGGLNATPTAPPITITHTASYGSIGISPPSMINVKLVPEHDRASRMIIGMYLDPSTGKSTYVTRVYDSDNQQHAAQLFYEEFGRENVDRIFIMREYDG